MVSFKDGSSSASDNDIIRTQIESLLEIMLVQVNNRKKKITVSCFPTFKLSLQLGVYCSYMSLISSV